MYIKVDHRHYTDINYLWKQHWCYQQPHSSGEMDVFVDIKMVEGNCGSKSSPTCKGDQTTVWLLILLLPVVLCLIWDRFSRVQLLRAYTKVGMHHFNDPHAQVLEDGAHVPAPFTWPVLLMCCIFISTTSNSHQFLSYTATNHHFIGKFHYSMNDLLPNPWHQFQRTHHLG